MPLARLAVPERDSLQLTVRQLNRESHAAADSVDLGAWVTSHTLRHSFARHLENGVDVRVTQVLAGHAKIESTARYTHVATKVLHSIESPLDRLTRQSKRKSPK